MKDKKVICNEYKCNWTGVESEILTAESPFEKGEIISACPECKEINTIVYACDEPGCWKQATCGTPTENGYRNTCGKHAP